MRLDVNGKIVANATAADIAGGIDGRAGEKAWYLSLTRPDGLYLEVTPSDVGTSDMLRLANGNEEKGLRHVAQAPVAPDRAKSILSDFLRGGTAWRALWAETGDRTSDRVLTGQDTFSTSTMSWVCGFIALGLGQLYFLQSGYILVACLAIALLIMVGTKGLREVQVRRWPTAPGMITKSDLQARVRKFQSEAARLDNIPAVEYRFTIAGRPYVGTRIGLNTQYAGVDVGALVAKYPVGAIVQVAYNPKNPVDCLLDPYANKGILLDFIKLSAFVAGLAAVLYYGGRFASRWIAGRFPDANAPHAALAFGIGILLLVVHVWYLTRRKPATIEAPRVPGKIVVSEVEMIQQDSAAEDPRYQTGPYYQPTIEVSYLVRGLNYALRTAIPNQQLGKNTPETAKAQLLPWPVGREVTVGYNPANPAAASVVADGPMPPDKESWMVPAFQILIILSCFAAGTRALGLF